jgi:hypothetical protein
MIETSGGTSHGIALIPKQFLFHAPALRGKSAGSTFVGRMRWPVMGFRARCGLVCWRLHGSWATRY